jgi:Domain of unknown function (DUF4157)
VPRHGAGQLWSSLTWRPSQPAGSHSAGDEISEHEADAWASAVAGNGADRRASTGAAQSDDVPEHARNIVASAGEPLGTDTRSTMEGVFGRNFESVRIHADEQAGASARTEGAEAYTLGQHVVFGTGRYAPETSTGRALLAHELTHVAQQAHGPSVLQRQPTVPRRFRILSLAEIQKDAAREARRKLTGQTSAKVCRSIAKPADETNCPLVLTPGHAISVIGEAAGGAWLKIAAAGLPGFGPQEHAWVMGAFAQEVMPAPATSSSSSKPATGEVKTPREAKKPAQEAAKRPGRPPRPGEMQGPYVNFGTSTVSLAVAPPGLLDVFEKSHFAEVLEAETIESLVSKVLARADLHPILELAIVAHGTSEPEPQEFLPFGEDAIGLMEKERMAKTFGKLKGHFHPSGRIRLFHCYLGHSAEVLKLLSSTVGVPVEANKGRYYTVFGLSTGAPVVCQPSGECE